MIDTMKLNQLEIVRTVGTHRPTDTHFNIRIPRVMVKINHDTQRITYNTNIFVNAPDCMVYPKNSIITQNFITVRRVNSCDLSHVAVRIGDEYIIPENTPLICASFYNYNTLYIIDSYVN